MNLVFFSTAFPQPGAPDRAPYNLRLCEALAGQHDLTVMSPIAWTSAWRAQPPLRSSVRVLYPTFVYPPGVLQSTHGWWLWRSIRSSARAAVEERPPDAIISYWTWPDGCAAAQLARSCSAPVVMMVGGSDVLVRTVDAAYRRRVVRTLARANAVVAVSEQIGRAVASLGVSPDRIAVVRRGVNRDLFSPGARSDARRRIGLADGERVLLWVGRLSDVKHPDLLLDALERLPSRYAGDWRTVVVGDGPLRRRLIRRVERGVLRERVSFISRLEPSTLAEWYRACDALVVSSRSEGIPNVVNEAKACGTRVVATDVGDISEVLDESDRLVPAGDPDRLAAAIVEVLSEPARDLPASRLPTWAESAAALVEVIQKVRADSHRAVAAAPLHAPAAARLRTD